MTKKLFAILLAAVLTLTVAACNNDTADSSSKGSSAPSSSAPSSSSASSSENASSKLPEDPHISGDLGSLKDNLPTESTPEDSDANKPQAEAPNDYTGPIVEVPAISAGAGKTVTVKGESPYTYKTAAWNGPVGYTIIIPYGDTGARQAAELVKNYFYFCTGENLHIAYDTSITEGDKEILVGNTNRKASPKNLKENQFKVLVSGKKLVFAGGHSATLEFAVQRFFRTGYTAGIVPTFEGSNDFSSTTFLKGYTYVWGDDFEGLEVDFTKWSFDKKMGGFSDLEVAYTKDVISTGDGRLKLAAIHTPKSGKPYKVPYSTTTMRHMNFVYGYAEIRAKVPFFRGAWPSFWTQSTDVVSSKYGVYRTKNYFVEVDIFEVFGNSNTVVPNLHKWYDKNHYDYGKLHNAGDSSHTTSGTDKNFYHNAATINNEYHTYGWEWTPTEMSMFVDGVKYKTYDITKSFDKNTDMIGFHDPEFVMFNNHVFTPGSSYKPNLITGNEAKLPANYHIDYFRLYQKTDGRSKLYIDRTLTNVYEGR